MSDTALWPISHDARHLHSQALVWDAHSVLPLTTTVDLSVLERHRALGVNYVSLNVGMDFNPIEQTIAVLAHFRDAVSHHRRSFALVDSVGSIWQAKRENKLAIGFDLEGSDMLDGRLSMLRLYRDLGVNQMHLIYNRANSVGGGCHDDVDGGLTEFGRDVIAKMNALGIIADVSHSGIRTSLEIMERSIRPVVFSHANARALVDHPRNVTDAQIKACAATGGVIGINGIALFLGDKAAGVQALLDHIDHIVQTAGPDHAGLGLDFEFAPDPADQPDGFKPETWWPASLGYGPSSATITAPERLPEITEGLLARGYGEADTRKILGLNFLRVAEATWV